jgi:cyanophycin synthetase
MDTAHENVKLPAHLTDDLGPTTLYLLEEIARRGIPYRRFQRSSLLILGQGKYQRKLRTAVTDSTSGLGMEIASDKEETKQLLEENGFPIPRGFLIIYEDELREVLSKMNFPVVIKPLNGNQGRGVTTNVDSLKKALFAFDLAKRISDYIIVEEYIRGEDYRLLVVNSKFVAATKRTPAFVIGNGISSIAELIARENTNPERGNTSAHVLAKIKIDATTDKILAEKGLTLASILPGGEILHVKSTANISAGGTATDVTDQVHPEIVFLAERVARLFHLDICGVDIMATTVDEPLTHNTGAIIEVNAGPGLRMHTNPTHGTPRNVASQILEMLFPTGQTRIPIVAVTQSSNESLLKTLLTLAETNKLQAGCASHKSAIINGHSVYVGSAAQNATCVLSDTNVEFAVIECDLREAEHGFDLCNVAIINSADEILLASLCFATGYVLVNIDNIDPSEISERVTCNIAVFSLSNNSEKILHYNNGKGIGAWHEEDRIFIYDNGRINSVHHDVNLQGSYSALIPALLTAYVLEWDVIQES